MVLTVIRKKIKITNTFILHLSEDGLSVFFLFFLIFIIKFDIINIYKSL